MTAPISLNPPWPMTAVPPPIARHIRAMLTAAKHCRDRRFTSASKPRRPRKPSIGKRIAAAERSGKRVTSITTPDGITLHFDKTEDTEASNPWLADLDKVTKQ
jgi:hypothetical protein